MSKKELQKLQSDLDALIEKNKFQDVFVELFKHAFFKSSTLHQLRQEFLDGKSNDTFRQRLGTFMHTYILEQMENAPDAVEETPVSQDTRKSDLESELAYLQNKIEQAKNELASLQSAKQNSPIISPKDEIKELFVKVENAMNNQEKISLYTKIIKLDDEQGNAYCGRGNIFYDMGEYDKALQDFDKASYCNHTEDKYYLYRGKIKYKLKKYDEAISDCNKYLNTSQNNIEALYVIAQCYSASKNKEKAVEYIGIVFRLDNTYRSKFQEDEVFHWLIKRYFDDVKWFVL